MGKILAIDHGEKRSGLALSDWGQTVASPREVVEGEAALWRSLGHLLRAEEVERIVLGLPLNMDGTVGPRARRVLAFKDELEKRTGVPVEMWDERLTTHQAETLLLDAGVRGRKKGRKVDKIAAQLLLQSYLDQRQARARDVET